MSDKEREEIKALVEGMTLEEKKQVIAVLPSELLFEELKFRDRRNRDLLEKVKGLLN